MSDFSGRTPKKLTGTISNSEFWPDLNIGDFQEVMRIPAEYREATIIENLSFACTLINRELSEMRLTWKAEGANEFIDVPSESINGAAETLALYHRAVFTQAKALLLEVYPGMNRREKAEHEGRDQESIESLINSSGQAVRLLRGLQTTLDVVRI